MTRLVSRIGLLTALGILWLEHAAAARIAMRHWCLPMRPDTTQSTSGADPPAARYQGSARSGSIGACRFSLNVAVTRFVLRITTNRLFLQNFPRERVRYSRRMSRESSVYGITARRLIRAASAWRGLMSTLWVSGTNTQRTINNAVSPSFSQRSPQARVIPMPRDQSVGNCASSTACRDTSSGMSILTKRCRATAAGSRTSLCTRISRIAVAGFGAQ